MIHSVITNITIIPPPSYGPIGNRNKQNLALNIPSGYGSTTV